MPLEARDGLVGPWHKQATVESSRPVHVSLYDDQGPDLKSGRKSLVDPVAVGQEPSNEPDRLEARRDDQFDMQPI